MRNLSAILILLLSSCIQNERREITAFYDIDSLVSAQLVELNTTQPMLSKTGTIDGNPGDVRFKPDSITWERELGMFRALDINEPRLVEMYSTTVEETSNGSVVSYTSSDPENTRINWIKIERVGDQIKSLRAELSERNPIYGNRREIGMSFTTDGLLNEYYVNGGEKLSIKDSLAYRMNATVIRD